jgi:uncharacterized membrane protein
LVDSSSSSIVGSCSCGSFVPGGVGGGSAGNSNAGEINYCCGKKGSSCGRGVFVTVMIAAVVVVLLLLLLMMMMIIVKIKKGQF